MSTKPDIAQARSKPKAPGKANSGRHHQDNGTGGAMSSMSKGSEEAPQTSGSYGHTYVRMTRKVHQDRENQTRMEHAHLATSTSSSSATSLSLSFALQKGLRQGRLIEQRMDVPLLVLVHLRVQRGLLQRRSASIKDSKKSKKLQHLLGLGVFLLLFLLCLLALRLGASSATIRSV